MAHTLLAVPLASYPITVERPREGEIMENRTSKEYLKYVFSQEEKADIAIEMAQKVSELSQAEDEKKAIMSDFKSRIDGLQARVNSAAIKLNNGYEMRSIECEVVPNWEEKIWEYIREDTGEITKTAQMTPEDLQLKLEV